MRQRHLLMITLSKVASTSLVVICTGQLGAYVAALRLLDGLAGGVESGTA